MKFDWPENLNIKEYNELDSTNDEAKRLSQSDTSNYLIIADIQTKGRGRSGKKWVSTHGNLYFSLLLKEHYPLSFLNALPSIVSLAIAKTLSECGISEHKIKLKWPNDILVNEKKIAGILLESKINFDNNSLDYLIIGCGINIVSFPEITTYKATSFYEEQKQNVNKKQLLEIVLKNIYFYLKIYEETGLKKIITLWQASEWGLGRKVSLSLQDKEIRGVYKGINAEGSAVIESEEGELLIISSGEIFFNQ